MNHFTLIRWINCKYGEALMVRELTICNLLYVYSVIEQIKGILMYFKVHRLLNNWYKDVCFIDTWLLKV